ncbi:hypothetical protein [Nonlabens spongiae]|uniref:hypothetical protein n=1 Tax=Nonlabens spongiae TaxID=331648 RepID=UPI0012F4A287|nr:hypothetical protein [Nonlabens spongiae]
MKEEKNMSANEFAQIVLGNDGVDSTIEVRTIPPHDIKVSYNKDFVKWATDNLF